MNTERAVQLIDVHSPPGNLDIMIELSEIKYHPVVTKIFPNSTLLNKIKVGDILVSVENENVAGKTLADIEYILSKRKDFSRKLTVLRDGRKSMKKSNLKIKSKPADTDGKHETFRYFSSSTNNNDSTQHKQMRSSYEKNRSEHNNKVNQSLNRNKTQTLEVFVPKGKLGIQLKKNEDGKTINVSDIDPASKLIDQVLIGDILLSVNDENVTHMDLLDVSRLIQIRSKEIRKLNILRSYCTQ